MIARGNRIARASQKEKGSTVMNVAIENVEDILSWDVSDEALEIAGTAWQEFAGGYTLQFCTSMDCAPGILGRDVALTFCRSSFCLVPPGGLFVTGAI
jgi:hypothetical protein